MAKEQSFEELETKYLEAKKVYDAELAEINRLELERTAKDRKEKIRLDAVENQRVEDYHLLEHIRNFWSELGIEEKDQTLELLWNITGYKLWTSRQGIQFDQTKDYARIKNAMDRLNSQKELEKGK